MRDPIDDAFARQVAAIMRRPDAPTGIIASNSDITLALLRIFIGLRIAYPRDVSLIAFDAPPWAEVLTPPLAVVAPPVAEIARRTWELLRARMEGAGGRQRRIALEATLIERASLRAAAAGALAPPRRVTSMHAGHVPTSAACDDRRRHAVLLVARLDRQVPGAELPDPAARLGALDVPGRSRRRCGSARRWSSASFARSARSCRSREASCSSCAACCS